MECPNCHNGVRNTDKFCGNCGYALVGYDFSIGRKQINDQQPNNMYSNQNMNYQYNYQQGYINPQNINNVNN